MDDERLKQVMKSIIWSVHATEIEIPQAEMPMC